MEKILQFPLVKIIFGFFVCMIPITIGTLPLSKIMAEYDEPKNLIFCAVFGCLTLITYFYFFRFYENRKITELSIRSLPGNLGLGILIGMTFQSLVIFIMFLAGDYKVLSVNNIKHLMPGLEISILSAITEEVIFRGIIFRITEEKLGSILALLISSLFFGAVHLSNPNSSIYASASIVIEAGLLLGASYTYSRSLWLPIAIHFSWNLSESGVYGVPDSGMLIFNSLITAKREGSSLITGGNFGPEASLQSLLLGLTGALILLYFSKKENKIVKPFWVKTVGIPVN